MDPLLTKFMVFSMLLTVQICGLFAARPCLSNGYTSKVLSPLLYTILNSLPVLVWNISPECDDMFANTELFFMVLLMGLNKYVEAIEKSFKKDQIYLYIVGII